MERLQKTSPSLSLTEEQKKELADIDSKYRAKIAEKELFLKSKSERRERKARLTRSNCWRSNSPQTFGGYRASAKQAKKNCARGLRNCSRVSVRRAPHVMQTSLHLARRGGYNNYLTTEVAFSRSRAVSRTPRFGKSGSRKPSICARLIVRTPSCFCRCSMLRRNFSILVQCTFGRK